MPVVSSVAVKLIVAFPVTKLPVKPKSWFVIACRSPTSTRRASGPPTQTQSITLGVRDSIRRLTRKPGRSERYKPAFGSTPSGACRLSTHRARRRNF
jgi:hypothetical protein